MLIADIILFLLIFCSILRLYNIVKGKPIPGAKLLYNLPAVRSDILGGFFLMGTQNKAIVHRDCGILERYFSTRPAPQSSSSDGLSPYGPQFTYDEFVQSSSSFSSILMSLGVFIGGLAFMMLPPVRILPTQFDRSETILTIQQVRWLVKTFGPQPGTGASDE